MPFCLATLLTIYLIKYVIDSTVAKQKGILYRTLADLCSVRAIVYKMTAASLRFPSACE